MSQLSGKVTGRLVVTTMIPVCAMGILFWGCLLSFFSFPMSDNINRQIKNSTVITQQRSDIWARIPGNLSYNLTKSIDVSIPAREAGGAPQKFSINLQKLNRTYSNLNYRPTYSAIEYNEDYSSNNYDEIEDKQLTDVPNFSVFSLWTKLVGDNRPDYIKAFMALSNVKKLMQSTDIEFRYFTYNVYQWGFNNQTILNQVALFNLEKSVQDQIFNDDTYGFGDIGTLKQWIRAYYSGADSDLYKEIQAHFKIDADAMAAIIGPRSMIAQLDRAFRGNLDIACGYNANTNKTEQMVNDQWSRGLITKLTQIPVFDASNSSLMPTSVRDLYNNPVDKRIPNSFNLVAGYQPELYYFMRYVLGFQESETEMNMDNSISLLNEDPLSMQTLLNPGNLQFLFEQYKQGDLKSIASRMSKNKRHPLTTKQVDAIYKYLLYITDKDFSKGQFDDSPYYKEHQAYGSLLAKTLRVSYSHIRDVFQDWYKPRFFAAYNKVGSFDCQKYLTDAGLAAPDATDKCLEIDFYDPALLQVYIMAVGNETMQSLMTNETGIDNTTIKNLYDATRDGSLASNLAKMEADLAKSFACGDGTTATSCSYEELALMQWTTAKVTQKANWPTSVNTDDQKILIDSKSISDSNFRGIPGEFDQLFQKPEIMHYLPDGMTVTMDQAWKIFDRSVESLTSLDQKWRAALVTDYVMRNPANATNKKILEDIYGIADFYSFFSSARTMVQTYLLGGAFKTLTVKEITLGYEEPRFKYIFRNSTDPNDDFFDGNDVDIDSYITPILTLESPRVNNQTVSIYTGSIDMGHVAKVRFVNLKDYINLNQPIYDGRNVTWYQASPTAQLKQFQNSTNGNQWATSRTNSGANHTQDQLQTLDLTHLSMFNYQDDKIKSDLSWYGIRKAHYLCKQFTSKDQPAQGQTIFLKGMNQNVDITNNTMKVQTETGIIFNKTIQANYKLNLQQSPPTPSAAEGGATNLYLPLPDWDGRDASYPLYTEKTDQWIDTDQFDDQFGFVRQLASASTGATVAFISLTGCSAIGLLFFIFLYRCKHYYVKPEAAVFHQPQGGVSYD